MTLDPVQTNPDHYTVAFENEHVRVLEYRDQPGDLTTPHEHPDSVMYTLSSFQRRLHHAGATRDVEISAGNVFWIPAQQHAGENIGTTESHSIFVELKESARTPTSAAGIGPEATPPR